MIGPGTYTGPAVTADAVVELVDSITYQAGWSFRAEVYRSYEDRYLGEPDGLDVVAIVIERTIADSDFPPNYQVRLPYMVGRTVTVDVSSVGSLEEVEYVILREIIAWTADLEEIEHEAREFFRVHVGSDRENDAGYLKWKAPFHPHRYDGNLAWRRWGGDDVTD